MSKSRLAFEEWYTQAYLGENPGHALDRHLDGYMHLDTHFCWLGWVAFEQRFMSTLLADPRMKEEIARALAKHDADCWGVYGPNNPDKIRSEYVEGRWKQHEQEAQACLDALARMAGGKPL